MKPNYYEILGVERSATETQIRQRFRELARKYHPDRYKSRKEEAERTFQTLTEALNVLTNPARRRQHDAETQNPSGKAGGELSQVSKAYMSRGVRAYNDGDYSGAREHFDMAVKHDPSDAKGFYYLALASARNPATMRQAVQAIESAVQLESYNPLYLKTAGLLCKRVGLAAKAERFLEQALQWDQENQEIREALEQLRRARGESKEGGKGLLDSLFKKG
ncbi:MAG TPA: DnaJ domain-containing protein [Thermoanaerobaculia bacterium]|nr:DnaJ domain-containing protein [Thermoanaerobaculia bacterium]